MKVSAIVPGAFLFKVCSTAFVGKIKWLAFMRQAIFVYHEILFLQHGNEGLG